MIWPMRLGLAVVGKNGAGNTLKLTCGGHQVYNERMQYARSVAWRQHLIRPMMFSNGGLP